MRIHCCADMVRAVSTTCSQHGDRYDCPDALLEYSGKFDEYGLIIHDGGHSSVTIAFCPWCGSRLPPSKRDRWSEALRALGMDPSTGDIPSAYETDEWWAGGEGSSGLDGKRAV